MEKSKAALKESKRAEKNAKFAAKTAAKAATEPRIKNTRHHHPKPRLKSPSSLTKRLQGSDKTRLTS